MPRSSSLAEPQFERAVSELEDTILKELAARPLSAPELVELYKEGTFAAGWQFERTIDGKNVRLNLLLPFDFPFVPPKFGFASAPKILTYPHVEEDGTLCLLSSSASVDSSRPVEIVRELLADAEDLLQRSFSKSSREDFRKEFLSYWNKVVTDSAKKFVVNLRPEVPSRIVAVWHSTTNSFFGETEAELIQWLGNRNPTLKKFDVLQAAVIWLDRAMLPEHYPKSTAGLLEVVRKHGGPEGIRVLRSFAASCPDQAEILLGTRSDAGAFYAGITLYKPDGTQNRYSKDESPLTRGFRIGRVPATILADRYLNAAQPVKRNDAERADHTWIHGRDVDSGQFSLAGKHVVILGCGSVGSPVAKLLATAGVGKLTLVDPDILTWANIGRHYLGARYVGGNKARFLAEELQENCPHLQIKGEPMSWESLVNERPDVLRNADLIISTIGVWSSEGLLNQWQRDNQGPPTVYGWTEAFASAGHAVAIFSNGPCFRCQLSEHGEPKLRVTQWPTSTLKAEPACGVMFQPYGPIEVSNTCNIVAEQAVDVLLGRVENSREKIWAARKALVKSNGGDWTPEWLALTGDNTKDGFSWERAWEQNSECPVCERAMAAC